MLRPAKSGVSKRGIWLPARERGWAWGGLGGFVDIGKPISTPPTLANRSRRASPRGTLVHPESTEARESLSQINHSP